MFEPEASQQELPPEAQGFQPPEDIGKPLPQQPLTPTKGKPILLTAQDGSKHLFPAGTTEDQMRKTLKMGPAPPKKNEENLVDKARPWIAGAVGAGAALGTSLIPGVGESGIAQTVAEGAAYTAVDSALRYAGANPPKSYSEALTESGKDAALNAVAGKLVNGVFKGVKAGFNIGQDQFYKLAPTVSQALEKYGLNILAKGSQFLEDYGVPAVKAKALDRTAGEGFTQALAHANAVNGRNPVTNSSPGKLLDKIKGAISLAIDEEPKPSIPVPEKPTLSMPDHPGYPETPVLPEKPQIGKSMGTGMKTSQLREHQLNVDKIKADYAAQKEAIDATHGRASAAAKEQFKQETEQYKIAMKAYDEQASIFTPGQEAMNLLEHGDDRFKAIDRVIEDPDRLAKVLKVGSLTGSPAMNVKQDIAAYKFMDMVNKATTKDVKGGIRLDPDMLGNLWNDPKMSQQFDLLYGKAGKERIGEFFKDIGYVQKMQGANPTIGKGRISYLNTGKFVIGISSVMHALTSGDPTALGVATGLQVSASTMGRLLTNPTTSRIISQMAKGTLKENPAWTSRVLGNALKNFSVGLVGADGKVQDGEIVENPETGRLEFKSR